MQIDKFLQRKGMSGREFCRLIGVGDSALRRWRCGLSKPSGRLIARISVLTEGKVRYQDWYAAELEAERLASARQLSDAA